MDTDSIELGDILWGADAIADALNITPKKAYRLLQKGMIPARKINGRYMTTPRALRRWLMSIEQSLNVEAA